MRGKKLRSFIIVSLVVHFIVLFIFILLFLPKNIMTKSSPGPISFGVIDKFKGSDRDIGTNSLQNKKDNRAIENKLAASKKTGINRNNNLKLSKQKKSLSKKVEDFSNNKRFENEPFKQIKGSSELSESGINASSLDYTKGKEIGEKSDLNTNELSRIKNNRINGTGRQSLTKDMELAYPDYKLIPKPTYPMIARRRGYEGAVILKVFVLESGSVGDIELERSSGHEILDESALDAVKDWVFIPGKRNGEAISSWVTVPIKFQLNSG